MVLLIHCSSRNIFSKQTQIGGRNRLYTLMAIKIINSSKIKNTMSLRCIQSLCSFCWMHDFRLLTKFVTKFLFVCTFVITLAI